MDPDEIQERLDDISDHLDRGYRISEYRRLLEGLSPGDGGRAEALTYLGDDLRDEGLLDEARDTFQQAAEDGGDTVLSPLVGLLHVELDAGDDDRVDELLAELMAASRADRLVIGDYEWIAEALEDAGRLKAALRWFTIPLRDIQPGDIAMMPVPCLEGRWRVRRALGLPVDAYDEAREVHRELEDLTPS